MSHWGDPPARWGAQPGKQAGYLLNLIGGLFASKVWAGSVRVLFVWRVIWLLGMQAPHATDWRAHAI